MDTWLESLSPALWKALESVFPPPAYDKPPQELSMNQVATPTPPKYLWDTRENCRHSVRVICDEEGLTVAQKNDLSSTVHCESNYYPRCVHPNTINGRVSSTDWGIAQVNDFWHIGNGKDFPSTEYVLDNPEACVRWMCRQWKAGNGRLWVCKLKGLSAHYSA